MSRVAVVGAGPAGLTAAHELDRLGHAVRVYERDRVVGGIARTVAYKGFRFDIGGHRFFTKLAPVQRLWEDVMGDDFLVRPRLSRIYYRGRFFDYPLRPINALAGLGPIESIRIVASYARAQMFQETEERTFEQWVTNRFGRRLFEVFFKTYTEKVWGMSCSEIGADWAAQRIKNLDLGTAVRNALLGSRGSDGVVTTLIDRFQYPRLGPGMLWERLRDRLAERGVETVLEAEVVRVAHDGRRVREIGVRRDGAEERIEVDHLLSSMPIGDLVRSMDPPPPSTVLEAAGRLRHRDFLTVVLIVDEPDLFPDNWIYIHAPEVRVGRIQNFKNWSPAMVPDPGKTSLGLEYFVQEGDELWSADDEELIRLGTRETAELGLIDPARVVDGTVVRMPRAYPVYDPGYRAALDTIRSWLATIGNLHSIGRNGQHRYNNQDHSMMTGLYAARRVDGEDHDVWAVNVEPEYHEAGSTPETTTAETGRSTPTAYVPTLEEALRSAFARYDPIALGTAVGAVAGGGLFLATAIIVLRGQGDPGLALSLLGQYLVGYEVTWRGALIGLVFAGAVGFAFGDVLARMINRLIGWHEAILEHELEALGTLDPLDTLEDGP